MPYDLGSVPIHEDGARGHERAQLVEGGGVVDEADVADAQDGAQVVRDGALEVLEENYTGDTNETGEAQK